MEEFIDNFLEFREWLEKNSEKYPEVFDKFKELDLDRVF